MPDLNVFTLGTKLNGAQSPPSAFQEVRRIYGEVIAWYLHEKISKGRLSKALRLTSIVLATLGGSAPIAAEIFPQLNISIGYLFLAVAAGLQLVDKYFGFSSAWARYVSTALHLNSTLLRMELEFARQQAEESDAATLWATLERYVEELARAVGDETAAWTTEFHEGLTESRPAARSQQ